MSKAFQFMYLPIAIALEPDHEAQDALRERLEGILDRIPGMVLPELQHLAWWAFLSEVRSRRDAVDWHVDLNAIMATLSHWLPNHEVTEPAPLKPQATPAELSKARRELVAEVIRRTGDSKSSLYRAAKVDKADFYRWLRGEIKSTSAISRNIETSLKRRLPYRRFRLERSDVQRSA